MQIAVKSKLFDRKELVMSIIRQCGFKKLIQAVSTAQIDLGKFKTFFKYFKIETVFQDVIKFLITFFGSRLLKNSKKLIFRFFLG